jgi:hypothetical protein
MQSPSRLTDSEIYEELKRLKGYIAADEKLIRKIDGLLPGKKGSIKRSLEHDKKGAQKAIKTYEKRREALKAEVKKRTS